MDNLCNSVGALGAWNGHFLYDGRIYSSPACGGRGRDGAPHGRVVPPGEARTHRELGMIQRPGRIALLLAGLVCAFLLAPAWAEN